MQHVGWVKTMEPALGRKPSCNGVADLLVVSQQHSAWSFDMGRDSLHQAFGGEGLVDRGSLKPWEGI